VFSQDIYFLKSMYILGIGGYFFTPYL